MVAAYFRFPLGVYALTTARSTGTSQISDDFIEGIEFEAVSIASSLPPLFVTRILDSNLGRQPQQLSMPSQEASSNAAPGSSSGSTDRQAQDAQGAGGTSPPRTEQELAQVRTPKPKSPQSNSNTVKPPRTRLFSITTCSHLPKLGDLDDSDPRSWAPFDFSQDPEFYCILHPCPALQQHELDAAVAPLIGSLRSGLNGSRIA